MRLQRLRTTAVALLAAFSVAAALAPAEAASNARQKKMQPAQGWESPSYLTGGKATFARAGTSFGAYPTWARFAFEQGQGG
jgi:invasion protein IalB